MSDTKMEEEQFTILNFPWTDKQSNYQIVTKQHVLLPPLALKIKQLEFKIHTDINLKIQLRSVFTRGIEGKQHLLTEIIWFIGE